MLSRICRLLGVVFCDCSVNLSQNAFQTYMCGLILGPCFCCNPFLWRAIDFRFLLGRFRYFLWILEFLLLCFSTSLLFCLFALLFFLFLCFSASLLVCFSCFSVILFSPAFLLFLLLSFLLPCFFAFCFSCFAAFMLLCLSISTCCSHAFS